MFSAASVPSRRRRQYGRPTGATSSPPGPVSPRMRGAQLRADRRSGNWTYPVHAGEPWSPRPPRAIRGCLASAAHLGLVDGPAVLGLAFGDRRHVQRPPAAAASLAAGESQRLKDPAAAGTFRSSAHPPRLSPAQWIPSITPLPW